MASTQNPSSGDLPFRTGKMLTNAKRLLHPVIASMPNRISRSVTARRYLQRIGANVSIYTDSSYETFGVIPARIGRLRAVFPIPSDVLGDGGGEIVRIT